MAFSHAVVVGEKIAFPSVLVIVFQRSSNFFFGEKYVVHSLNVQFFQFFMGEIVMIVMQFIVIGIADVMPVTEHTCRVAKVTAEVYKVDCVSFDFNRFLCVLFGFCFGERFNGGSSIQMRPIQHPQYVPFFLYVSFQISQISSAFFLDVKTEAF